MALYARTMSNEPTTEAVIFAPFMNEALYEAGFFLTTTTDHLLHDEKIPRDIVVKAFIEKLFQLTALPSKDETHSATLQKQNEALLQSLQTRLNETLRSYERRETGEPD